MGPSKMAAIEISWLHFSNNRSSIQSFLEISGGNVLNCVIVVITEFPIDDVASARTFAGPGTSAAKTLPITHFPYKNLMLSHTFAL